MNNKYLIGFLGLVLVIAIGFAFVAPERFVGAFAPTRQAQSFLQGFFAGTTRQLTVTNTGNISSTAALAASTSTLGNLSNGRNTLTLTFTTSSPTSSLTAAQFCGYGVIIISAGGTITTSTLTLPVATSTNATCLTADGSRFANILKNASGSAFSVTIATSTGDTLYKGLNSSSSNSIAGAQAASFEVIRDSSTTDMIRFGQSF